MDPGTLPSLRHAANANFSLAAHIDMRLARWIAALFVLDLVSWLTLPISVLRLGHAHGWWLPLAVGAALRLIRSAAGALSAEHTRPLMASRVGAIALSMGDPDDLGSTFMSVWLGARALEGAVPALFAGTLATGVAAVLAARAMDPRAIVALALGAIAGVAVRQITRKRGQAALDVSVDARVRAGRWLSAASRGRYEINGIARAWFLGAVTESARSWARADREYLVTMRSLGFAQMLAGAVAAGVVIVATESLRPLPGVVPWLALGAAAAPALAAVRALDEILALRRTFAVLPKLPPVPEGNMVLPKDSNTVALTCVTVRYKDSLALDGVSLNLPLRGVTAIVGRNGAGKSTLAQVVAGRLVPDDGACTVGSVATSDLAPEVVAMVPQQPCLVDTLSVRENVLLVAPTATDAAIEAVLNSLGLCVRSSHLAGALSRGEQRRIAVARAILREPALLVLDEPDAWLDRAGRDVLSTVIQEEGKRRGVVLVTHRADLVQWVDQVVLLGANHRVEAVGSPREVSKHPEYQALLVAGS